MTLREEQSPVADFLKLGQDAPISSPSLAVSGVTHPFEKAKRESLGKILWNWHRIRTRKC